MFVQASVFVQANVFLTDNSKGLLQNLAVYRKLQILMVQAPGVDLIKNFHSKIAYSVLLAKPFHIG